MFSPPFSLFLSLSLSFSRYEPAIKFETSWVCDFLRLFSFPFPLLSLIFMIFFLSFFLNLFPLSFSFLSFPLFPYFLFFIIPFWTQKQFQFPSRHGLRLRSRFLDLNGYYRLYFSSLRSPIVQNSFPPFFLLPSFIFCLLFYRIFMSSLDLQSALKNISQFCTPGIVFPFSSFLAWNLMALL